MFGCCKTFSGKYIFFGNANFRKRKMFLCVWLHFKKFSGKYFLVFGKEEGKHKSENTKQKPQPGKKIINDHITRSRSRRDRDLAVDRVVGLKLELAISDWIFSSRARALSLSLSLFPEVN